VDEVAQDLPADGGVRVEQPVKYRDARYGHAAECNGWWRHSWE
jgi:hypothetical protein